MKLSKETQDKIQAIQIDLQKIQTPIFGFGGLTYQKFYATHVQGKITPEATWNYNEVFTVYGTNFGLQKEIKATFKRWELALAKIKDEKIEEALNQQIQIVKLLQSIKENDLPSSEVITIENQVKEVALSIVIIKDKIKGVLSSVIKYPTIEELEKSKEVQNVQTFNATSDVNLTKEEVLKVAQDSISNRSIVEKKSEINYVKYAIIGIFVIVLILMFKFVKK